MCTQFARSFSINSILIVEVVDRADIIKTTTSDVIAGGRIGTCHDPTGAQGNCMNFVRGVGIPDNELSVLRSRHEMSTVSSPVHGIDLGKMSTKGATRAHHDAR